MSEQVDQGPEVIIVGAGPVGMATAIELGQRGVRCALVEKETKPHRVPKGQSLTNRSLELFQHWGCAEALRAARRLPRDFPIGNVTCYRDLTSPYWHYQEGGGPGRGQAVSGLFAQAPERLPQYETERVMSARLESIAEVSVLRGLRLTEAQQTADDVAVAFESVADGVRMEMRAAYLVGADGAGSAVRKLAGLTSRTRQLGDRMVLLIFRSPTFEAHLARFPATTTLRVLKPELHGHWQFFGRVDSKDTFFFHAPVTRLATLEQRDLIALMQNAAGFSFDADVEHAGFWDLRISIADQYRVGRIFIAGDACHSHPPYGGFGLNTGLEDACNLGWKLSAALQGWGGEALLDSYVAERRPIFVQTADLISAGIERERAFLDAHDPTIDLPDFEAAWAKSPQETWAATYLPHYAGSPVVAGAGSPGIDGRAVRVAYAGGHLAPSTLSDGRAVFGALGAGFTLLALDAIEGGAVFAVAARQCGVPLTVITDTYADGRADYGARLVLVRPDHYVVWAGDEAPSDIPALFRAVAGQTDR